MVLVVAWPSAAVSFSIHLGLPIDLITTAKFSMTLDSFGFYLSICLFLGLVQFVTKDDVERTISKTPRLKIEVALINL